MRALTAAAVACFTLLLGLALVATPAAAEPARYTLDPAHSWVQFELSHFGTSTIRGRLGPAEGSVSLDRSAGRGEIGVTIPMASVSTGLAMFDKHLRDGELLLSAQVRIAALEAASFRPRGMDEAVLAVLQPHLHPESEH